ncbi:MAG: glycerate-2-kinase family protein [Paracoccaceae bacterium]
MTRDAMRAEALRLFQAGLAAADPAAVVDAELSRAPLAPGLRWHVIAIGKAARRMAEAALARVDAASALVVTNYENAAPLPGAEVLAAGHPVPDENGARAGQRVLARLAELGPGDAVLALISGGGSALLPAPAEGMTLADKAEVNRLLLASGAEIGQMNLIRQQLSRLKGGGFLAAAAPAPVRALILSDVVGDDLRAIASGPTVAPLGTRAEASAILRDLGLWERLPQIRGGTSVPAPYVAGSAHRR